MISDRQLNGYDYRACDFAQDKPLEEYGKLKEDGHKYIKAEKGSGCKDTKLGCKLWHDCFSDPECPYLNCY